MIIDVQATKERILGLPQLGFKLLEENEEGTGVVLVTAVDDNFSRNMIVINQSAVGIGVQAPNKEGVLSVTFNQVPLDLIDLLVMVEPQQQVEVQPEEQPAPKAKGKK